MTGYPYSCVQLEVFKLMVHLFIARFSSHIPTCFSVLVNMNVSILILCTLKPKKELVLKIGKL